MTDITKTIDYWVDGADYDIDTAENLLEAGKFPYALFFGHLAVEKLLKALVVKETLRHAPYTHSLTLLAKKSGVELSDELMDKLAEITEFSIIARYPNEQDFYKAFTREFTESKFKEINEVFQWFREKF